MDETTETHAPQDDAARPTPEDTGINPINLGVAIALAGAAAIHFAMAPAHLDEETSHGVFFVAVAWVQALLAVGVVLRSRLQRPALMATVAVNLFVIGVWVLSRTAGVPGSDPEAAAFPDTLAYALETLAVVGAGLALARRGAPVRTKAAQPAVLGLGAVAVLALVSASFAPSLGGTHSHGAAGDDHHADGTDDHSTMTAEEMAAHGGDTGHDHATSAEEEVPWEQQRERALMGDVPDGELQRLRQLNAEYLADKLRTRSEKLQSLPEDEREELIATFVEWQMANSLKAEHGADHGDGAAGNHTEGPMEWIPLNDPNETLTLQKQLKEAGTVVQAYPTAADAMEAGYFQVTPWVPGIAAHYLSVRNTVDDEFDPTKPEILLYNGNNPTSELVGVSYTWLGDEAPEGFAGENDTWHVHPALCLVDTFVVGNDNTPEDLCESVGGRKDGGFGQPLWMMHLWQVPGWESPWGLFSGENPQINMATVDLGKE